MNKKSLLFESLLAIGSNQAGVYDTPEQLLHAAIKEIAQITNIKSISRFYQTPAFPTGSGPNFVNAALHVECASGPETFLQELHQIEDRFDRKRPHRWAARTLDLDLIAYGDMILPDPQTCQTWMDLRIEDQKTTPPTQIILPHPRLQDRAFVLGPLMDICPDWVHPITQKNVKQMWESLPLTERSAITPLNA